MNAEEGEKYIMDPLIQELTKEQVAQIQNIISRELKANIDNIHISNKKL